jgi:NADH-quinone oxidoreductase subunit L
MSEQIDKLLVLIPALPLAGFLLLAFFGRAIGTRSHWPVVLAFAGSFVLSVPLLLRVEREASAMASDQNAVGYEHICTLWTWADVQDAYSLQGSQAPHQTPDNQTPRPALPFRIDITLRADPLTAFMLCMVTFISTLVAIYASGYMHGDPGYPRFFAYIALFVFSMTMLVSVSNFVLLYVFWEAVGLCSYLLVGFWYEKPAAAAAGKKAFMVNRVGDFGFALGLFLIWTTYGTLNFHDAQTSAGTQIAGVLGQTRLLNPTLSHWSVSNGPLATGYASGGVAIAICLLLMAGACGKSAQFPLHVWLPDAMEGPTPVSALIHAATMVTAGVYMVARCTPLFMASAGSAWLTIGGAPVDAQMVVAVIGGFTAIMAGTIAITQNDLKRVLAYSTISQLGYMFLSLGTGSLVGIVAGMFHLLTHAFFKALLFLGSGSVMHAMGGVIDMRRIGGLRRLMPVTCGTFMIGCLALAGVVPFSGFWSKDAILDAVREKAHGAQGLVHNVYGGLYWIGVFTAGLTAFYTFRVFFLTFFGEERIPREAGLHAHESPRVMTVPLVILAVLTAVVGGYYAMTQGIFDFLRQTPSLAYQTIAQTAAEPKLDLSVSLLSTLVVAIGIGLAAYFYLGDPSQIKLLARLPIVRPLYTLSYGKFFFDQIYQWLIVWPLRAIAAISYWFDQYVIDALVDLIGGIPAAFGSRLRLMQNGMVQFYAFAMMTGLLILIGLLVFWPG